MSEKGYEPDIEVRFENVAEVPEADVLVVSASHIRDAPCATANNISPWSLTTEGGFHLPVRTSDLGA